jgi:hypothetical protein
MSGYMEERPGQGDVLNNRFKQGWIRKGASSACARFIWVQGLRDENHSSLDCLRNISARNLGPLESDLPHRSK